MSKEKLLLGASVAVIIHIGLPSMQPALPEASPLARSVPFSLLAGTTPDDNGNPLYPEKLWAANGKLVTLTGFAAPFNDPQDLTEWILTQSGGGGGCFFCAPPGIAGAVLIRCAGKERIAAGDAVTFEGILHLKTPESGDGKNNFFFTVEQARLVGSPQ